MSVIKKYLSLNALLLCVACAGCDVLWEPFLVERPHHEGDLWEPEGSDDLAAASGDLGSDCLGDPGNLIMNPSFEVPRSGPNPNGEANNTGDPRSTIPGPWSGCCLQATDGGTTWTVTQKVTRCGLRSLQVQSKTADGNQLAQQLPEQLDSAGSPFLLSGHVLVLSTAGGGRIQLEVWDAAEQVKIGSTGTLGEPTAAWVPLSHRGMMPRGGRLQVRISSSGNVLAFVDDLLLRTQ